MLSAASASAEAADMCNSKDFSFLIGKRYDAEIIDFVNHKYKSNLIRWIAPGMAYTDDYSSNRLNIYINNKKIILRVWCG